jgi:hypothetical protein
MLYTARCDRCGTRHPYVRSVAERHDTPECCGAPTTKVIDAPMIGAMCFAGTHKGFVAHRNDGTPVHLDSGTDYKRYMQSENKLSYTEGVAEAEHQRKNIEEKHDEGRRQAVIEAYRELAN